MPQIGPAEILVVLVIGMLVFGPKRLPEIGRQVGNAMRHVKGFQESVMSELDGVMPMHEAAEAEAPTASTWSPTHRDDDAPGGSRPPSRFRAPQSASSMQR